MLTEVLSEELIITELKSNTKDEVLEEMISHLVRTGVVKEKDTFTKAVKEREKLETTAIGSGVAIPHARSEVVEGMAVVFAKSREGVDLQSLDEKPVHLVFMIACSQNIGKEYLQILARIARLCKNSKMKDSLIKAQDTKEIMSLFKGFDAGSDKFEAVRLKKGRTVYPNHNESA